MHDWRETLARIEEHGNCANGDYDADDLRKLIDQRDRAVELLRSMRTVYYRRIGHEFNDDEALEAFLVTMEDAETFLVSLDANGPGARSET